MPTRVRFVGGEPPPDHAEIAIALLPLVIEGSTVTVECDDPDDLGWRVLLDRPGCHTSFRVGRNAAPAEWAERVVSVLKSKGPTTGDFSQPSVVLDLLALRH